MTQLVFIHGPGAGGCADSYVHQLEHFPGSVAPNLPGHLSGEPCPDVARYTEWLRGWLWAQGMNQDLVLCGFTLGACIALQYGLDYPGEVKVTVFYQNGHDAHEFKRFEAVKDVLAWAIEAFKVDSSLATES